MSGLSKSVHMGNTTHNGWPSKRAQALCCQRGNTLICSRWARMDRRSQDWMEQYNGDWQGWRNVISTGKRVAPYCERESNNEWVWRTKAKRSMEKFIHTIAVSFLALYMTHPPPYSSITLTFFYLFYTQLSILGLSLLWNAHYRNTCIFTCYVSLISLVICLSPHCRVGFLS